ncbi:hypothetical protein BDW22DRAFT_1357485 [Trametopsis cervina]|nr:hypothetical protein BDW22DRAFT_1357485 [Trametopsis cervina]
MSGRAAKEPTRQQLSSRLHYSQQTPLFIQRLQNRVSGIPDDEEEDDEYEDDGSGRPPIPKRPAIPERPDDDPGSAGEDDEGEAPQIVVLKEGKHLSEREVENEKRKARGLSPLREAADEEKDAQETSKANSSSSKPKAKSQAQVLSFSSSGSSTKPGAKKRKIVGDADAGESSAKAAKPSKKPKKAQKKLLSFGDDA